MAEEQPRGCRGRRGGYVRRQPCHGVDANEEEPRPNRRDQRDLKIAAQGRRIRELERLLEHARFDDFHDVNRAEEESEGSDTHSTESYNEEDENPWGVNQPDRDRRYRPGRYRSSPNLGVKVDIPNFEGKSHPDDFIDWLYIVERVFDIKNLSDEQKGRKVHDYELGKMKKKLMAKFLPVQFQQKAFIEYHNFKQSVGMLVEEFTSEFDHLRLRCDVVEEDEETIARYLASQKPEIADVVHLLQYLSYNDVCRLARKVESQQKKKVSSWSSSRFSGRFIGSDTGKKVASPISNSTRSTSSATSYNPTSSREGVSTNKRCYKCQGLRHIATDCPNRKIITIIEEDNGPVFDKYEDDKYEQHYDQEEIMYADCEEALVVRRSLSMVTKDNESWLRHNIFHTRCTCLGKVCNVIIDGGSCENVISSIMVDKLGLKTEEHPKPYTLSWFKKGNEVKVSKRCLVNFSIGKKYTDEVWCDVVSMEACHILLGRPWQFDHKTKHNGFKNTYTFEKDDTTITLGPLDLRKEARNQFLSQAEFLTEAHEANSMFALILVEPNAGTYNIPHEVKSVLEEFKDVVSKELPPGLPLMRDIQHCIDFVPEAVIPHKAAYRMNTKEHEELQRQVQDLLEKGSIRESLSPCEVPALLVPKKDGSWRMCIDSRAVNKITIKYHFPIPRFDDLIDQLHGATIFSKIDLRNGYHHIRVRPGDEWKTVFKTRNGLYEWMVMPFGLSNAPSTFMRLMNQIFWSYIGKFVVLYFDDILVFSTLVEQHLNYLRRVFEVLRAQKLYTNAEKCHFLSNEVMFLGYIVSKEGIQMDPAKIDAILNWSTPKNINDIRSFHGLASFYRRFIHNFSTIIAPITECIKGSKFKWSQEADEAFGLLKNKVTTAPVLTLADFNEVFEVHCDASGVGIRGVLSQKSQPIAFFSEKLNETRRKYSTYDKDFYAMVRSLEYWRHYLIAKEFILYSDHEALKYINGQHNLKPRHAKWVEYLQAYSFFIKHKAGALNKVADGVESKTHVTLNNASSVLKEKSKPNRFNGYMKTYEHIEKQNAKYKEWVDKRQKKVVFKEGDLVLIRLGKERFSAGRFGKLQPRADGPFRVLKRINDNAYKIDLPGEYNVSATFNVADPSPYVTEEETNEPK
ncbi:reverse transcriptase domain-containing protein [Tanacetum coccineum]|uniref:RNA-directed DNA polymerase n=1 Tax=Tanacetum coccineum TaxID=301880 RepID=A0ABQ5GWZ4_9ASTR